MPTMTSSAPGKIQPATRENRVQQLARAMSPTIYCPSTDVVRCVREQHSRGSGQ